MQRGLLPSWGFSEAVREVPLSLRERAEVRGACEGARHEEVRLASTSPHPNPLPEGEGIPFCQNLFPEGEGIPGSRHELLQPYRICRPVAAWT